MLYFIEYGIMIKLGMYLYVYVCIIIGSKLVCVRVLSSIL